MFLAAAAVDGVPCGEISGERINGALRGRGKGRLACSALSTYIGSDLNSPPYIWQTEFSSKYMGE